MKTTHVKNNKENTIYLGRKYNTFQHYGNPFIIDKDGDRKEVIQLFRLWINGTAYRHIESERRKWVLANLEVLKEYEFGSCYCFPEPCHVDVYVEMIDE